MGTRVEEHKQLQQQLQQQQIDENRRTVGGSVDATDSTDGIDSHDENAW